MGRVDQGASSARATASLRVRASSFSRMFSTCFRTVCGETTSTAAISLVVFPRPIQRRISSSRGVKRARRSPRRRRSARRTILINDGRKSSSNERSRSLKSRLPRAYSDSRHDLVRGGVDAGDAGSALVHHPDRARRGGDSLRLRPDRDRRDHAVRLRVDAQHSVVGDAGNPHSAVAGDCLAATSGKRRAGMMRLDLGASRRMSHSRWTPHGSCASRCHPPR